MKISLTPGQAVTIHGWISARQILTWGDVLANEKINFELLHHKCNISENTLHTLQPDLELWIKNKKASLSDCPRMRSWEAHPIKHFHSDLSELIAMKWDLSTLTKMGVTYEDLVEIGLNSDNMLLFNFTLFTWSGLGMKKEHAAKMPPAALFRLFQMPRGDILNSLSN